MAKFPLVQTTIASLKTEEDQAKFNLGLEKLNDLIIETYKFDAEKSLKRHQDNLGNKLLQELYPRDKFEDFELQVKEIVDRLAKWLGKIDKFDNLNNAENKVIRLLVLEILHKKDNNVKEREFLLESGNKEVVLRPIPLIKMKNEKMVNTINDKGIVILKSVENVGVYLVSKSESAASDLLISLNSSRVKGTEDKAKTDIERGDLIFKCELRALRKDTDEKRQIPRKHVKKDCAEFGKCMIVSVERQNSDLKSGVQGIVEIRFTEKHEVLTIAPGSEHDPDIRNTVTDLLDNFGLNPEQEYEKKEKTKLLVSIVEGFVESLSDRDKQIIHLYYIENNSKKDLEKVLEEKLNNNTIDRIGKKLSNKILNNNNSDMAEFIKDNWKLFVRILEKKLDADKKL